MTGLLLLRRGLPTIDYRDLQKCGVSRRRRLHHRFHFGATLAVLVCTSRSCAALHTPPRHSSKRNHHGVAAYRDCASAGYRIAKLSGPNKNSGSSFERSNKLQTSNLIL
jgi:hypothetical protein